MGFFDFDQYLMREAKRHGAKIISLILSWDNTTTRGMGGAFADHVIAWTDLMKTELVQLHDIKPKNVFVGGVAHFDHYFREDSVYPRKQFLAKFGLSEHRKIIFFATKSPTGFPWNPDVVEILADAVSRNLFVCPCQLLVRLHPIHFRRQNGALRFKHFFDRYDQLARDHNHLVFNIPNIQSTAIAFDMPDTELSDVASIFSYSDVMVNIFSTMNIEASIFDLPTINVAFDGSSHREKKSPRENIKIDEMQSHNQRIIHTKGVRVAYSPNELIDGINLYLQNPDLDKEGRRRIVEQECGPHQGSAGRRIADHILQVIHSGA